MYYKITITAFCFFVLLISCVETDPPEVFEKEVEEYQLLYDYDPQHVYWHKIALIRFFKLVALGSEFGDDFKITKKWNKPMRIYLYGNVTSELYNETVQIADEINELISDNFKIRIVEKREESNFTVFLGSASDYAHEFPNTSSFIKQNKGLFTVYHNEDFEIYKGHMFVDVDNCLPTERKHILREELTQSLGLTNDVPYYHGSIFYEDWSATTTYSYLDKEVIRLLYHPKLIPGLNEQDAQQALMTIMGLN